jgi:limiting CO2-inducible B/C-like protein
MPTLLSPISSSIQTPQVPFDFKETLDQNFPDAYPCDAFVDYSQFRLHPFGMNQKNSIACVSVCRDEIATPFMNRLHNAWNGAFNFSSLAGMLYLGVTGFQAAHHHAPNTDGRERYVYFAFPHIAIDENGTPGNCRRSGRQTMSQACGALLKILEDCSQGEVSLDLNPNDVEQSLLTQRLFGKFGSAEIPDLITLTLATQHIIREDLERMIQLTVDPSTTDYAVFTGVQIHGPAHKDWIWVETSYVVVDGVRKPLL